MNTLEMIRKRPHVETVDDERDIDNGIIVTLRPGVAFKADPGCGVRGFDTLTEAERDTRSSAVCARRK